MTNVELQCQPCLVHEYIIYNLYKYNVNPRDPLRAYIHTIYNMFTDCSMVEPQKEGDGDVSFGQLVRFCRPSSLILNSHVIGRSAKPVDYLSPTNHR